MKNQNHRLVSGAAYIHQHGVDPYFKKGYNDYMKELPFDYDIEDRRNACMYERGRAFGVYTKIAKAPKATWRNNKLSKAAGERLLTATYYKYVI